MSGWGEAEGGASRCAWAVAPDVNIDRVERWVRSRSEMKYVSVVDLVRHVGDNHDDWSTGKVEYRSNKRGHTIMYRTREQAIRIQNRLNTKGQR